jgi:outer membrane protein
MRIRVLTVFSVLILGLLSYNVSGQTKLTDLVNYTLEHSREIRKSELQCKEADYMRKETIGHGLPQIEASSSYSKILYDVKIDQSYYDMVTNSVPADYQDIVTGILRGIDDIDQVRMFSAGIQVTQLIYSQSYLVGLKASRKAQELYSILKEKNEEDVIAEVATGYYQAGSLMLQLRTVEKSIENLKEIHRIAQLSYQNDMIKESQVNRLKVTISNLEVTRQTIANGVTIQLNYLKALAGMPSDSILAIDTAMLVNDFVNNSASSTFAIENVPAYKALLKQDEIYGQQIRLAKAVFCPTLAAFGKYSFSSYGIGSSSMSDLTVYPTFGLSLSIPIFSSGVNYYKLKQSQVKQAQLREDIYKTKDLLTVSYNNAFLEYQTANNLLAAQKENLELAQKVYNQTSLQYQEGMASMADLLNVNSDFLQADNSYNQQILKCKTAEIKMLKASGNLKKLVSK